MTQLLRKISNWYFLHKALPYWCILAMDCMTVYVSGLFVYYFQHGGLELAQRFWQVTLGLSVCLIVYILSFVAFHTFHGVMRYSSFVDLHRVAYSTATAGIGICILHQVQVYAGLTSFLVSKVLSCSLLWQPCLCGAYECLSNQCMIFTVVIVAYRKSLSMAV